MWTTEETKKKRNETSRGKKNNNSTITVQNSLSAKYPNKVNWRYNAWRSQVEWNTDSNHKLYWWIKTMHSKRPYTQLLNYSPRQSNQDIYGGNRNSNKKQQSERRIAIMNEEKHQISIRVCHRVLSSKPVGYCWLLFVIIFDFAR